MSETYWVGLGKKNTVFKAEESLVTPDNYPNFDYCVGPFKMRSEAVLRSKVEKNLTGTFNDPFCNGGKGR